LTKKALRRNKMDWDNNPYYNPKNMDLEIIDSIDCAGSYEFDILVVWKHLSTGVFYWAHDSGCSCPTPFEGYGCLEDLRVLDFDDPDWLRAVEHQGDGYDVQEFLTKVRGTVKG
jgi:hypothetical protein